MFLLYNVLLTLTSPIWGLWMWWRTRQRKEAPNWSERCGRYTIPKPGKKKRVWIHAVSVGEVVAALPILQELRSRKNVPEIVLSVTTSSGHETARERAKDFYDHLIYFPIDVLRFQMSAVQTVRPDVVAIMETELWFNFLWSADVFGARRMLINGRISDRSFPRSMKVRGYYAAMLRYMNRCLMQTPIDAERIQALGAPSAEVFGNTKFDQGVDGKGNLGKLVADLGLTVDPSVSRVVVGSLRHEEFEMLAPAIRSWVQAGVQVVVAPRHVERAAALRDALGGSAPLRSANEALANHLLILDSYGELNTLYGWADVVVIGGGFANLGGQNLIQPLAQGKPVVAGLHMQNFRDTTQQARAVGAIVQCDASQVGATVQGLLSDPQRRLAMGAAGQKVVQDNLGASRRYADAILAEADLSEAR